MKRHRAITVIWLLVYLALIWTGCETGLKPLIILATILVLFVPPFVMHLLACQRVIRITRMQYPDFWAKTKSRNLGMDLRFYLFDEQTFGDTQLTVAKADLKWWLKAGILGIMLFLPTLFLINVVSK
jgi:hypothetical protein